MIKIRLAGALLFLCLATFSLQAKDPPAPDLSGSWSGLWISDGSGHQGPMRATFQPAGDGSYDVLFTGRFFKVFPFRYRANLAVTGKEGNKIKLEGSKRLPGFGVFTFKALADEKSFRAEYSSRKDNGRFEFDR
ncbi:MAG: hypothetical protein EXR99_11740 [Gemmataceae bacterium]|nr:hypothetical protein [Gemmataceae bacterium]